MTQYSLTDSESLKAMINRWILDGSQWINEVIVYRMEKYRDDAFISALRNYSEAHSLPINKGA